MSHDRSPRDVSPVLEELLESLSAGRALDLGTGLGRNARALAARGWTVDALDLSRARLERARKRWDRDRSARREADAAGQNADSGSEAGEIEWILADVDSYAFPADTYDLVAISFLDARDRLPAVKAALAPGGVLFYEHYLASPPGESGPGDRFRFAPNELLDACRDLRVRYYAERRVDGDPRVTLVAREETRTDDGPQPHPVL